MINTLVCVIFCLILTASATPIAAPALSNSRIITAQLSELRDSASICVLGKFMLVAGGYPYTAIVDVIDLELETRVASANWTGTPRWGTGVAQWGTDGCLFIGGFASSTSVVPAKKRDIQASDMTVPDVDLVQIDLSTGAITGTSMLANYEDATNTAIAGAGCVNDPSTGYVWCFGGQSDTLTPPTLTTYVAYFNGTNWTQSTDLPTAINTSPDIAEATCRLWGTTVWCCGQYLNVCQNFDINAQSWSTFTLSSKRGGASVILLSQPNPSLVLWGGLDNETNGNYLSDAEVITFDGTSYSSTTFTDNKLWRFSAASTFASLGAGSFAFSAGAFNPYAFSLFWDGTTAAPSTTGFITDSSFNVNDMAYMGGAFYQNKFILCGGYTDSLTPIEYDNCWAFDITCPGANANGQDFWVNNATYVGCDMTQCAAGHYGSSCTPCTCGANEGCFDGYTGNGSCIVPCSTANSTCVNGVFDATTGSCVCQPGFYDATCSSACACSGSICNDGATGTGECVCAPGTYTPVGGANCSGTCNCGNGVCDDGNYGTGTCECSSGSYGSSCSSFCYCPPVVYSATEIKIFRCDDGVAGTGECVRLYSSASALSSLFGLVAVCISFLLL